MFELATLPLQALQGLACIEQPKNQPQGASMSSSAKFTRAGRFRFDETQTVYEDDLPEDMTSEEYGKWFTLSWVDIVRMGPKPVRDGDS